jgi:hypothetical protein
MGGNEDFDKLTEYSIYDLLKQPRREALLSDLCVRRRQNYADVLRGVLD